MLKNHYVVDKQFDICPMLVKKLFLYNRYDYLITQFIPSLPYKTKGLYFNTLNTKHANQLYIFNEENKVKEGNKGNTPSRNLRGLPWASVSSSVGLRGLPSTPHCF